MLKKLPKSENKKKENKNLVIMNYNIENKNKLLIIYFKNMENFDLFLLYV